jgi:ribosome-associated protein
MRKPRNGIRSGGGRKIAGGAAARKALPSRTVRDGERRADPRIMIHVTSTIVIAEDELSFEFIRSSGPGGQNVNKVATAVQLRFDVLHSPSLPDDVRIRLVRLAGKRLTGCGVLVITARRHRTQQQNRDDALERLVEMLRAASVPPKKRRKTRPTAASKQRRLEDKRRKSKVKRMRKRLSSGDE